MHMVVVGGGPTGVEYAGELHDFLIVRGRCGSDAIPNAYLSTISRTISESGTLKSQTSSESP